MNTLYCVILQVARNAFSKVKTNGWLVLLNFLVSEAEVKRKDFIKRPGAYLILDLLDQALFKKYEITVGEISMSRDLYVTFV